MGCLQTSCRDLSSTSTEILSFASSSSRDRSASARGKRGREEDYHESGFPLADGGFPVEDSGIPRSCPGGECVGGMPFRSSEIGRVHTTSSLLSTSSSNLLRRPRNSVDIQHDLHTSGSSLLHRRDSILNALSRSVDERDTGLRAFEKYPYGRNIQPEIQMFRRMQSRSRDAWARRSYRSSITSSATPGSIRTDPLLRPSSLLSLSHPRPQESPRNATGGRGAPVFETEFYRESIRNPILPIGDGLRSYCDPSSGQSIRSASSLQPYACVRFALDDDISSPYEIPLTRSASPMDSSRSSVPNPATLSIGHSIDSTLQVNQNMLNAPLSSLYRASNLS